LQTRFQAVDFQRQEQNIFHKDVRKRIPLKLRFWAEITNHVNEDVVCFLDSDTLVYKNITPYIQEDFDLLYTWKNETFPLNVGVVIIKNNRKIRKLLELWCERTEDIVNDEEKLKSACALHGAADQQALSDLIGTSNYENDITRSFEFGSIRFRGVPCDELNQSNIVPVENSVSIFHYKTGWHPILLREEGFTANRPKKIALDLLHLWEQRYALYNRDLMNEFVIEATSQHQDIIDWSKFEYRETGELASEMIAVLAVIKELKIEVIIQVGKSSVDSETILAEGLKNDNIIIFCIALKNDDETSSDKIPSIGYPNVHLLFGDIHRTVSDIVDKHKSKQIAIVFNKPEGKDAFDLFSNVIAVNENVKAGFFHNCWRSGPKAVNFSRREIHKYYDRLFFTDHDEYVRRFNFLDQFGKAPEKLVHPKGWRPYTKGCNQIGSYGPTIAVVIPTARDKERWKKYFGYLSRDNRKRNLFSKFLSLIKKTIKRVFNIC
jgi:hypothetical protein